MDRLIEQNVGVFKGFAESGLEFKAEIVSPYFGEYRPILGSFILVSIDMERKILGRITKFYPTGIMTGSEGDEYLAALIKEEREVPEDLKDSKLRYNVTIKLLGGIQSSGNEFLFSPSIRELPHLGASVGIPTKDVIEFICGLGISGDSIPVDIGHLAFGAKLFDGKQGDPVFLIRFDISHLIARRTFVFARAGYGKSVLVKLLVTKLYEKDQNAGLLIFDPEGEYAFTDKKGRPGLADIPDLHSKIVVFTDRKYSEEYASLIAGKVKLNLSEFNSADIVDQCIPESKHEMVFANRLRGLSDNEWKELIDLIVVHGYDVPDEDLHRILRTKEKDTAVEGAVLNNLPPVIFSLHDGNSTLLKQVRYQLRRGNIVIIDLSLLSMREGNDIAGLILNEILKKNRENFTAGSEGDLIRVVAVIEEAQSVLSTPLGDKSPFVRWAKEGRKYDLGCILVTQQPGAIAPELLSQGDNFFTFHLLSERDLKSLQSANAHFSNDILAKILNEPIKGNAYFWSAPDQPFVLPARITNFESYAKERSDKRAEASQVTALEEYLGQIRNLDDQLDEIVKREIERNRSIRICAKVKINGVQEENLLATKLWNVKYAIGGEMGTELKSLYGETYKGKWTIADEPLFGSLRRMKILDSREKLEIREDSRSIPYLILKRDSLELSRKATSEQLEFHQK